MGPTGVGRETKTGTGWKEIWDWGAGGRWKGETDGGKEAGSRWIIHAERGFKRGARRLGVDVIDRQCMLTWVIPRYNEQDDAFWFFSCTR